MKKKFIVIFTVCIASIALLLLKGKTISSADENKELLEPTTVTLMKERSKTDDSLIKILDEYSDDSDYIVAYPEEYGGGYLTCPDYSPSMGEVLDETGNTVIYKDNTQVTVGEVKQAIEEMQQ